jgi:hypothetical protein
MIFGRGRILSKNLSLSFARRCRARASRSRARRLNVEALETRVALSGGWTPLKNPMPGGGSASAEMELLSNGTVIVQGGGNSDAGTLYWWILTPDKKGNYTDGTWSKVPNPAGLEKLYGDSVTLTSGNVMVLGGEYSGPNLAKNFTTETEVYNPVTQVWTVTAPVPDTGIYYGDEPAQLLPNGTVLTPDGNNTNTYIYDPYNNTWSNGPNRLNGDTSYEENWLTLPDGEILAVPTNGTKLRTPQLFVPGATQAQDKWVDTANMPAILSYGPKGDYPEMGPGFLLPDGRVWQMGGNDLTAIFTPPSAGHPSGSWVAGPSLPQPLKGRTLTGADSAGAVLPNGDVIFDSSPWLSSPAYFYEFSPSANGGKGSITAISPPAPHSHPGESLNIEAQSTSMLVLPTGQILYDLEDDSRLWIYTPPGSPQNSWRPTISSVVAIPSSPYLLTGTQLNGISQGAAPGDDVATSTNFPIVRLTRKNGKVYFARTFDWSSTGAQTGSTVETTRFYLPQGLPRGKYSLQVVANGIASKKYSFKYE